MEPNRHMDIKRVVENRNPQKPFRTLEITAVTLAVILVGAFFYFHPSAPVGGQQVAADIKVNSPATYTEPMTLKSSGTTFSISALGANAAQAVTVGAVTKYTDAFTNTDVTETKQSDRIKEDIILKQPGHPATFTYQIDVAPYDVVKDAQGSLVFYQKGHSGESSFWRFEIPAPSMTDAKGKKSTVSDVESTLTTSGILTVRPSAAWLAKAAYPVDLDPTIIFIFRAGIPLTSTVPTYATWNPSDKAASITLSNANLTETTTNLPSLVRSVIGKSSGKWYWEYAGITTRNGTCGIASATDSLALPPGSDSTGHAVGMLSFNGNKSVNGTASSYASGTNTGDVIGIALDLDAGQLTYYINGTSQGVAASSLTGTYYAAVGTPGGGPGTVSSFTANFGATPFAYTPPAGYNAGLYTNTSSTVTAPTVPTIFRTPTSTLTLQVGASTDDAFRRLFGAYWNLTYPQNYAGSDDASNYQDGSGMRFTNITIPKGSTINSAYLVFHSRSSLSGTTINTRISAENVDNAATFADNATTFDARWAARTTARVNWDNIGAWAAGVDYNSPEIKTVIQEVVNRGGWSSGNGMAIFWDDFDGRSSHAVAYRLAYGYDESPTYAPKLVINYTLSNSTPTIFRIPGIAVQYLVVAGGGSGGGNNGGGGGAGGLLTGTYRAQQGAYTITVGGGGAAVTTSVQGNSGTNSSAFGLTAIGGGGGGDQYGATGTNVGLSGGSGGGGAYSSGTGGSATSGQGYAGGTGNGFSGNGAGGGGASMAGPNATNPSTAGGNGAASSISGSSVTYAGGGGGGNADAYTSAGGIGGGGTGGGNGLVPSSGTANTGGGGGGGSGNGTYANVSAAGGSGVVIISSPSAAASTTGSPTVTSSGGNTIYKFTSSGSITF